MPLKAVILARAVDAVTSWGWIETWFLNTWIIKLSEQWLIIAHRLHVSQLHMQDTQLWALAPSLTRCRGCSAAEWPHLWRGKRINTSRIIWEWAQWMPVKFNKRATCPDTRDSLLLGTCEPPTLTHMEWLRISMSYFLGSGQVCYCCLLASHMDPCGYVYFSMLTGVHWFSFFPLQVNFFSFVIAL